MIKSALKSKTLIVKPSAGSEGCGIFLVQQYKDIPPHAFKDHVAQEYIGEPLLLNGKKFDLRIYVAVTSFEPLSAFVCSEGLVRLCTLDYEKPSKENLHKLLGHLTNYSLNKLSADYKHAESLDEENASKQTLSQVYNTLKESIPDVEAILSAKIADVCAKTLVCFLPFF